MRILMFSWRGPNHPNAGGAEISTHEHTKGWVKKGHQVSLFTAYFKGAKKEEIIDGVRIMRKGNQLFGVHVQAFKWYLFQEHPKFDLVIDQFHGIPFFAPFYVRGKKLAFIHEVAKDVWQLNEWLFPLNFFISIVGKFVEPLIFRLYKNIPFMTVSQSTKKDLIDWGIKKENVTVIHNGVSVPKITIPNKEKTETVTFLGALAKDKGIEKALEVFKYLKKNYKQKLQFWVIGKCSSNYLDFLKRLSQQLNLESIKFWGYVSEKKKFELLARSHLLVNTSIREGWGLVVIEAASMGVPSVAFNVPGLKDSIVNNTTGILVEGYSTSDLGNNIIKLLEDKKMYNSMCTNAVSWSKNFSWEKASSESLKLINRITHH